MGWLSDLFGIDDAKREIRNAASQGQTTLQGGYDDVAGMYAPYREGGQQAYSNLLNLSGLTGGPNAAWDAYQQSPMYTSGMQAGVDAIDRSAVGRAGGNVLRDLTKYGSDYNARQFGDFYNRIGNIANTGYSATGATAGARTGLAQGQAGIQTNAGNELANAELAGGSILQKLIDTGVGMISFGAGGGFGTPTSGSLDMRKYTGVYDPRKYGTLY